MSENQNEVKKIYVAPELVEYGNIATITRTSAGNPIDNTDNGVDDVAGTA